MSTPIAMLDLGNDVYLRFTSKDVAQLYSPYRSIGQPPFLALTKQRLDINDPDFIFSALSYGLKDSRGNYIRDLNAYGAPGPLNLNDIPVPLSTLTGRIYQALQQVITG